MSITIQDPITKRADRPILITGPCSAETEHQMMRTAELMKEHDIPVDLFRAGIWKPRTRPNNFEGIGEKGLAWLKNVKATYGYKTTTEVANANHVDSALSADIDVFWLGARTTVNPFFVQEIADALKGNDVPVFIKNPINPDINLWKGAIERIYESGITKIGVVHRGFSTSGNTIYRNAPEWQIPIELKRTYPDIMMICDSSHICGNRSNLFEVSQTALDLNYHGVMLESHLAPDDAWSDAKQQVTPAELKLIFDRLRMRDSGTDNILFHENIEDLRERIDAIDKEMLQMMSSRMDISRKIGQYKKINNIAILQQSRWNDIIDRSVQSAGSLDLSKEFISRLFKAIHQESINQQERVLSQNDD